MIPYRNYASKARFLRWAEKSHLSVSESFLESRILPEFAWTNRLDPPSHAIRLSVQNGYAQRMFSNLHKIWFGSILAIGFAIAWALGFLMERIKVPALVGYLLAGIIISPATPGFVGDVNIASELSEIGVMLLMFGVGLHFSMTDLIRVKNIAVPGAILQMGLATCLGAVLAHFWGWPWGQSIVFGMCLSCASTVVLLKGLESRGILESGDGQIAVGWLVVEDTRPS